MVNRDLERLNTLSYYNDRNTTIYRHFFSYHDEDNLSHDLWWFLRI